jgi:hypothetical protein
MGKLVVVVGSWLQVASSTSPAARTPPFAINREDPHKVVNKVAVV